jgi:RNA-binding protein Tab2/Atab2
MADPLNSAHSHPASTNSASANSASASSASPNQLNPPVPVPENLWGERWRFAALPAGELLEAFGGRMIPVQSVPLDLDPLKLGLASTAPVPGVVIDGGRQSRQLAQWLEGEGPIGITFILGDLDGLILRSGNRDRWILATSQDPEVRQAGLTFTERLQASSGLHFLLVQPDDSGMTYSGFWLLRSADKSLTGL